MTNASVLENATTTTARKVVTPPLRTAGPMETRADRDMSRTEHEEARRLCGEGGGGEKGGEEGGEGAGRGRVLRGRGPPNFSLVDS